MEDEVLNTTLNGKPFKIYIHYENEPSEKTIEIFARKLVEIAYRHVNDKEFMKKMGEK